MLCSNYLTLAQSPEWDLKPEQMKALYLMERPHAFGYEGDLIEISTIDDRVWLTMEEYKHLERFRAVACVRVAA